MRLKIFFSKCLFILGGIIIALAASEGTLRVTGYGKTVEILKRKVIYLKRSGTREALHIYRSDPESLEIGWLYLPNTQGVMATSEFTIQYKINSKGLRDREHSYEKAADVFRMVALGDSLTFGEAVDADKRYTDVIERVLRNTEVVNMGVQGFGIDQALLYLEKEGFKYNPDMVILFIDDPGIQRCASFKREGGFKPRFELDASGENLVLEPFPRGALAKQFPGPKGRGGSYRRHLLDNSLLFNFLKYSFIKNKIEKKLREEPEKKDRLFWGQISKNVSEAKQTDTPEGQLLKIVSLILDRYVLDCRQHHARFAIVNVDVKKLNSIEAYCRQKQIPYVDLSDELKEAETVRNIRFTIDPHYNDFGHRVIGECVADYLAKTYSWEKKQ